MKKRVFLKCKVNKEVRMLNVTEKTITGLGDNVKLESSTTLLDSIILIYRDVDINNQDDNSNSSGNSGDAAEKARREETADNGEVKKQIDKFEKLTKNEK